MDKISEYVSVASLVLVVVSWCVFAATFWWQKRKPAESASNEAKRQPKSYLGIVLQGIAFGLVWALHRAPAFSPFIGEQYALNVALQIAAVLLAFGSVWLARRAIAELGRQWSFEARLVEGHQLVTSGVYQIVRHPIYAAMFGKLIATGIILSHWAVLPVAVVVFLIGTKIRTASEEKLLRTEFPAEYQEYAARVPALIPFLNIF